MSRAVRFFLLCVAASGIGASAQTLDIGGRRCATVDPPLSEVIETVQIVDAARQQGLVAALRAAGETTIPVAFHVVTRGGGTSEGNIPRAWVEAQIDTLNAAFAPAGYRFVLALVNRVENAEWYGGLLINSSEERAMKAALALDPGHYLNVFTASLGRDYLGWAATPDASSESDIQGGVVLLDQSLPGGSASPYNLGHTGTHEVGHWMGLLHTFQGGCSAPNDGVSDTPQERDGASGCPVGRDTCPSDPGEDPITNYMDYSDDVCMTGFTAGQNTRVQALVSRFRPTLSAGDVVLADVSRLAFDDVPLAVTSTDSVAVTNLRAAPVTITSVSSTNPAFAVRGLPLAVPAGEAVRLPLDFTPTESGAQSTVLTLSLDGGGNLSVSVVGSAGRVPRLTVPTVEVDAETVEEGTGATTFSLENDGNGALTFAVETERLPAWITEVSPRSGTVDPDDDVVIDVGFSAAGLSPDTYEATLIVTTNDPQATQVEISVELLVRARPEARLSGPEPLAVELIENDATSGTVVLANTGAGDLTFQIDPETLPEGIATVTPLAGIVAPGGETVLVVSFSSTGLAVAEYPVTLQIQTNDPFAPVLDVPIALTVLERPDRLTIRPIYPNPGSGEITIPLAVPVEDEAVAEVFDARGRRVATLLDGPLGDGYPALTWDASQAPAGVYVVRVRTAISTAVETVVIAR